MTIKHKKITRLFFTELGRIITQEMSDPRIKFVTVTRVEVSTDIKHVKVYFSVFGEHEARISTEKGLISGRKYIQWSLTKKLKLKHTPRIDFVYDEGIVNSINVSRIIKQENFY